MTYHCATKKWLTWLVGWKSPPIQQYVTQTDLGWVQNNVRPQVMILEQPTPCFKFPAELLHKV